MRFSDWSSDVCSSDLLPSREALFLPAGPLPGGSAVVQRRLVDRWLDRRARRQRRFGRIVRRRLGGRIFDRFRNRRILDRRRFDRRKLRSEEHTSELQSLMRISYAVFCLKKKNKQNTLHTVLKTLFSTHLTLRRF